VVYSKYMRKTKKSIKIEVVGLTVFIAVLTFYVAFFTVNSNFVRADAGADAQCTAKVSDCVTQSNNKKTQAECAKELAGKASCTHPKCGVQRCNFPDAGGSNLVCGAVTDCPGQKGKIQDPNKTMKDAMKKKPPEGGKPPGGLPTPPKGEPKPKPTPPPKEPEKDKDKEKDKGIFEGVTDVVKKAAETALKTLEGIVAGGPPGDKGAADLAKQAQELAKPAVERFNVANPEDPVKQEAFKNYAEALAARDRVLPSESAQYMSKKQLDVSTSQINPNNESLADLAAASQNDLVPANVGGSDSADLQNNTIINIARAIRDFFSSFF
jgi:hypothetical protein